MSPKVNDGDLVHVAPCDPSEIRVGDIVLVRIRGRTYLHLVKARDGERLLIGNNRGKNNGWVGEGGVFGRVVEVIRT